MNEKILALSKVHRLSELLQQVHKHSLPSEDEGLLQDLHCLKLPHSGRKMLAVLLKEGSCNQRYLAGQLGISPQASSETVKKLEKKNCIVKVNGKQKNENLISLTEYGEEMAHLLERVISNHAEEVFAHFSAKEVEDFGILLEKLLCNVEKIDNNA